MSPYHSTYREGMPEEDFEIWRYLTIMCSQFSPILLRAQKSVLRTVEVCPSWCHLAARSMNSVIPDFKLEVIDGVVYDLKINEEKEFELVRTEHSWLKTRNNSLIDLIPIGAVSLPLIFTPPKKVENQEWKFTTHRYVEADISAKIKHILQQERYKQAFKVYTSMLERTRKKINFKAPVIN